METLLLEVGEYLFIIIVAGALLLGALIRAVTTVLINFSRERSRREIAAYIAEGSMTPEHGERILKADVQTYGGSGVCT